MLYAGYLKVDQIIDQNNFKVSFANLEVHHSFTNTIGSWIKIESNNNEYCQYINQIINSLLTGDIDTFCKELKTRVGTVFSFHDTARDKAESFYHGFMIGLTLVVASKPGYIITSNRETGYGRSDMCIKFDKPGDDETLSFIFEFKHTKEKDVNLHELAKAAKNQILEKNYSNEFIILKKPFLMIGMAFCGKNFEHFCDYTYFKIDK